MRKLKYVKLFENFQDGENTLTLVVNVANDYFNFYKVKFIKILDQTLGTEGRFQGGGDFEGLMIPATIEVEIIEARCFLDFNGECINTSSPEVKNEEKLIGKKLHLICKHVGKWSPGSKAKLGLKLKFDYDINGRKFADGNDIQVQTKQDAEKILNILKNELVTFHTDLYENTLDSIVWKRGER